MLYMYLTYIQMSVLTSRTVNAMQVTLGLLSG